MKRKVTIKVQIVPKYGAQDRYNVQIQYTEGGLIFTCDNHGKGFNLNEAQDYAFTIKDQIKETE